MSNKIYTCLHCGTQFVNLDGMLRCSHCGGRLAVMADEELAPVGTGRTTELEALKTRWRRATTDESRRANDRRDVIAHAYNLSLKEHKRDRSSETTLDYHRRITKARIHNQNLLEAQRKQKAEGKEYTLRTFTMLSGQQPKRTAWKQLGFSILALWLVVFGLVAWTDSQYDESELTSHFVEVEVRIGGFSPFGNLDAPVPNIDVMLYFINGTYSETIQTNFDGMGISSIAYPIFTELYATDLVGDNMGRFLVLPNSEADDACHAVLYFLG